MPVTASRPAAAEAERSSWRRERREFELICPTIPVPSPPLGEGWGAGL
jgi:hypothetical protein